MKEAISGAIMLGCWAIGMFFFRFWRKNSDQLFLFFGAAFWLLAVERFLLLLIDPHSEFQPYIYIVRLVAFLLILFAIYNKNRQPSAHSSDTKSQRLK
jgi:hypothetical protein